jgi:HPt (histidine-containing phosphotransfer) domain-containing protein
MDDYITKPLRRNELLRMVEKWLSGGVQSPPQAGPAAKQEASGETGEPIDYARALNEFEGDEAFLAEVLDGFIDQLREQAGTLKQAVLAGDSETVRREGHALKGGAGNLAAWELSDIGRKLEMMGQEGELGDTCAAVVARLESEAVRLEEYHRRRNAG